MPKRYGPLGPTSSSFPRKLISLGPQTNHHLTVNVYTADFAASLSLRNLTMNWGLQPCWQVPIGGTGIVSGHPVALPPGTLPPSDDPFHTRPNKAPFDLHRLAAGVRFLRLFPNLARLTLLVAFEESHSDEGVEDGSMIILNNPIGGVMVRQVGQRPRSPSGRRSILKIIADGVQQAMALEEQRDPTWTAPELRVLEVSDKSE